MGKWQSGIGAQLARAGILTCASLIPVNSSAIVFGELGLHSYLGQPLAATVSIGVGPGEQVDAACLSLGRQPVQSDAQLFYLTQAVLALEQVGARLNLKITTSRAINEPYIKLLLQANCGQGHYVREFTALLDPAPVVTQQPVSPSVPREIGLAATGNLPPPDSQGSGQPPGMAWDVRKGESLQSIAAGFYPRQLRMQDKMVRALRDANPHWRDVAPEAPLPDGAVLRVPDLRSIAPQVAMAQDMPAKPRQAPVAAQPVVAAAEKTSDLTRVPVPASSAVSGGEFRLKLSSGDLDLSLVGKMSEEQRQQLREKQLLLDADDQVANTLSMKNRIKQLESQITELQAALGSTNNRLAMSERMTAPAVRKAEPAPPEPASSGIDWLGWLENVSMRAMAGVALIVALLASVWWRWRRRQAEVRLDTELEHEFPPENVTHYTPAPQPQPQPQPPEIEVADAAPPVRDEKVEEEDFFHPTSIFDAQAETVTFTEAESVIDEVDLYLAYGWANRAIDLLQGYLENHPDDTQLWTKLLEIYSSQGMAQEFEQLALRCQSVMEAGNLWSSVKKMGRQLDPGNPLYRGAPDEQEETGPATVTDEPQLQQAEIPTLDTPLEFILDDAAPSAKEEAPVLIPESETLDLDPLFPEFVESIKKDPEDGTEKS